MKVYSFSEARQRLATLLDQARREGQVRIRRRDGREFVVQPAPARTGSPLNVAGLDLDLTISDVVKLVRESRSTSERFLGPAFRKAMELKERPPRRKGRSSNR